MGKKYVRLVICAAILFLCFVGTSSAETWYVDDDGGADFTRIQDAISAASAGDTIIVKPGKYTEHIVVDKQVTLKGEEYPIVDGEGTGTVIGIRADGVHIEGFKVMWCDPARENNDEGIEVWTNNCVIDNCIISDNNIGLGSGGNDNVITNCKFNDNRIGLVICNGERNSAKKNHFTNGGIILDNATNNLIANNIVELDSGISIYDGSEYNTIEGNRLQSNSWGAIEIRESKWGPTSHNNKIYHNNFIDNGLEFQAYDDGNNQWDNGAEGNYWSDYREKYPGAEEIDESGIWDKPYDNIGNFETGEKSGAKDKYPLMEPKSCKEEEKTDYGDSVERALIIGISNYKFMDALGQQPVNGAKGMYNLLRWGYGYDPENVLLLLDDEATCSTIIDQVFSFALKTDENDKFVFYYAGHGIEDKTKEEGIVPYDAIVTPKEASNVILDFESLFDEPISVGEFIAIFDACYSGGFSKEKDIDGNPSGIDGDKRVVLMSTKADDEISAWSPSDLRFTHYLLDAFASHTKEADANGDRRVSAEEAFEYAKNKGIILGWLQHPQIMDHYPSKLDRGTEVYISDDQIICDRIVGEGGSSVHIHAYDIDGNHVGIADSDTMVSEIPGSWYSGSTSHPEEIIIFGISEDVTFMIEGQLNEIFNFTLKQSNKNKDILLTYNNIAISEIGEATVVVSDANPNYLMEIDNDGDGTAEEKKEPDSIETIQKESERDGRLDNITAPDSIENVQRDKGIPSFEGVLAILGLLAVAYCLRRRK